MIGPLALIIAVALVCYALLPALSREYFARRWGRALALLEKGAIGTCSGIESDGIHFSAAASAEGKARTISTKTAAFILLSDEPTREIPAARLRRLDVGTRLILTEGTLPFRRRVIGILEPGSAAEALKNPADIVASCPPAATIYDPLRYVWAAIGIFAEFTFFITWLGAFHSPLPAVAAMIAIFGKALPWCPPGLFLTLLAHHLVYKGGADKKKDRQRKAVGLLLVTTGVLLNLVAVFFGILKSGWFRL